MSLRFKTLSLLAIVSLVLLVLQSLGAKLVLDNSYLKLEQKDARRNLGRVQNIFQDSLDQMTRSAGDWAHRDDTYQFVKNPSDGLVKGLSKAIFDNANWNHVLILDRQGQILKTLTYDFKTNSFIASPDALKQSVLPGWETFQPGEPRAHRNGVWMFNGEPHMFTSHWILDGNLEQPPEGLFIAIRAITQDLVASLSTRLRLDINIASVFPKGETPSPTILERATTDLQNPKFFNLNEEFSELFINISDYLNSPAMQLRVTLKRDFYQQAKTNSIYLFSTVLLLGLIFSLLIYVILEKFVLARVSQLSKDIAAVKAAQSFDVSVRDLGTDELGDLAATLNEMLRSQGKLHGLLESEQKKTEDLLLNIMPRKVIDQLKNDPSAIAERFNDTTILFADIVGFTAMSSVISPEELVQMLNTIFSAFDRLAEKHRLEKIKTIGDAYLVVGGLPERRKDHAQAIAAMALDMIEALATINQERGQDLKIRVGIHSGPVIAGVLGTKKFLYDLWGDAVNTASRMESSGVPGAIQVSEGTFALIKEDFVLESRGLIEVKGKGSMQTYFLKGHRADLATEAA
jgi:class 3 adenylate cyclase/sensor domain CHASE-containing protein